MTLLASSLGSKCYDIFLYLFMNHNISFCHGVFEPKCQNCKFLTQISFNFDLNYLLFTF